MGMTQKEKAISKIMQGQHEAEKGLTHFLEIDK